MILGSSQLIVCRNVCQKVEGKYLDEKFVVYSSIIAYSIRKNCSWFLLRNLDEIVKKVPQMSLLLASSNCKFVPIDFIADAMRVLTNSFQLFHTDFDW